MFTHLTPHSYHEMTRTHTHTQWERFLLYTHYELVMNSLPALTVVTCSNTIMTLKVKLKHLIIRLINNLTIQHETPTTTKDRNELLHAKTCAHT